MLLDRDDRLDPGGQIGHRLEVERLDGVELVDGRELDLLGRQRVDPGQHLLGDVAADQDGHPLAAPEQAGPAEHGRLLGPVGRLAVAADPDVGGAGQGQQLGEELGDLARVAGRDDGHAGQARHQGEILAGVVRHAAVGVGVAAAGADQDDRVAGVGDADPDRLEGAAGQERGDRVGDRPPALGGQPGRGLDEQRLGDADVDVTTQGLKRSR